MKRACTIHPTLGKEGKVLFCGHEMLPGQGSCLQFDWPTTLICWASLQVFGISNEVFIAPRLLKALDTMKYYLGRACWLYRQPFVSLSLSHCASRSTEATARRNLFKCNCVRIATQTNSNPHYVSQCPFLGDRLC